MPKSKKTVKKSATSQKYSEIIFWIVMSVVITFSIVGSVVYIEKENEKAYLKMLYNKNVSLLSDTVNYLEKKAAKEGDFSREEVFKEAYKKGAEDTIRLLISELSGCEEASLFDENGIVDVVSTNCVENQ